MKFKVGQVVRFRGVGGVSGVGGVGGVGSIGVVTRVSYGASAYPYSVKWFLSTPEITAHYTSSELGAVDEEN
jgi:hypothetical protein